MSMFMSGHLLLVRSREFVCHEFGMKIKKTLANAVRGVFYIATINFADRGLTAPATNTNFFLGMSRICDFRNDFCPVHSWQNIGVPIVLSSGKPITFIGILIG